MRIKACSQLSSIRGLRAVVRCDCNVPLRGTRVADDYKIIQVMPTIRYLLGRGAEQVVLVSHLGRPEGRPDAALSLAPVARRLQKLLGKPVTFVADVTRPGERSRLRKLPKGSIVLLENIRFYPGEEENDDTLARTLAGLGDIFINDALAVSHRAHASVARIQRHVPAYAGLLMEKELQAFAALQRPARPFVVVMGGAKLATKVAVIKRLRKRADHILLGGMLPYPFLAAAGLSTGKYVPDPGEIQLARKLAGPDIILPADYLVSRRQDGTGEAVVVPGDALPSDAWQFDIGPETIKHYARYLKAAKTILWNGPLGMFEEKPYRHGTLALARAIGGRQRQALTVAGGGETVMALQQAGVLEDLGWVSTGGGAMLSYLAGEKLPGLQKIVRRW